MEIISRGTNPKYPPHLIQISESEAFNQLSHSNALFIRWTSDWDCGYPTEWWYCIKDNGIGLDKLTSKQRYRVKKGINNSIITRCSNINYELCEEICDCAIKAFSDYPSIYRPKIDRKAFVNGMLSSKGDLWICRSRDDGVLCGYSICYVKNDYVELSQVKTIPTYQKFEINAALAFSICDYYLNTCKLNYVCDGSRNISHETEYQNFLVRVLGFRFSYCKLQLYIVGR